MHRPADNPQNHLYTQADALRSSLQAKLCALWERKGFLNWGSRACPDRIDEVWRLWELVDNRIKLFKKGEISFCDVNLIEITKASPGVRTKNQNGEWVQAYHRDTEVECRPDVLTVVTELNFLIDDVASEFGNGEG